MAASSGAVAVGTSLKGKIPDVDWSRNGRTLVLALSTTCHFCRESGPFYRRLQQEVKGRVKVLAILPQTESEGAQYLGEAGFNVDQVKQAVLPDIGVHGTPTMMLVDAKGRVTRIWFGKLQQQQEEEVLRTLRSAA
jgi:thioredoxin-related protein